MAGIRCKAKACPYYAEAGNEYCVQHRQAVLKHNSIPLDIGKRVEDDGYAFVPVSEVPSTARYNEAAGKLFQAVKVSHPGHALKVSMKIFKKITLATAQRYALDGGLRIGCRVVGDSGYLWKLNEEEIKKVEMKGERLRAARSKNRARKS